MIKKSPKPLAPGSGRIIAVCLSPVRGTPKVQVPRIDLRAFWGAEGDAHAGPWHRQLSLLANESADLVRKEGLDILPGAFGENIVTAGIELQFLRVGARLRVGAAEIELTQVGKECHDHCEIFKRVGMCVMPSQGVFCRVIQSGPVSPGDVIELVPD